MENKMVIDTYKEVCALLEGHFLLSSGKHSDRYCQSAKLLQYPDKAEKVIKVIIDQIKHLKIDAVVGPAMGGVVVSYEMARQLGVKGIFTERENNIMTLRRGFEIKKGDKVIISEDVVTTGKSTMETVKVIEELGGEVIALTALVDRRGEEVELPFPVYSATKLQVKTFEADSCPLCKKGIEYVKPGSRKI